KGTMSVGYLAAFITYSMDFVWPMEVFGELANEYSMIAASYKKINKIFAEEARIKNAEDAVEGPVAGSVEFDHVGFTVGEKEILKDITFKVEEGKTLGIMGETGSGKSSIVNLIGRLFDVTEGAVKVGGVDVRELNLTDLRKAIKYVSQETFLFSDTVKDNVRMGERKNIEEDAVVEASKLACADEFVSKMENKYDTIIGERGVGLSGGQRQRISIARAFVRNNPILIMDDSTSALDMETERDIHHALDKINGTKIIIAHRISAVRYADEIIVLKDGKIAERGTHEELLAHGGLYKETYDSQYGQNLMEVV
ncbi:MAG: ABC transporter ATP-binding protein, partial [Lachnospiraceae bacterium]|nr:ABC transporter ATP-binding protein [Lachnospiraceae bacterium]